MADINPTIPKKHYCECIKKYNQEAGMAGINQKKQDQIKCYLQKTHFRSKDTNRIKISGWKKILCKEPPQEN